MEKTDMLEAEITELWSMLIKPKKKRDAYRITAIYFLSQSYRITEVAQILMVDEGAMCAYKRSYERGGILFLVKINDKRRKEKLTSEQ